MGWPWAIRAAAFSADNTWLTVAAGGTHELLIFRNSAIPWNGGDPGDTLDSMLSLDDGKLRRLPLGGRPVTVQFVGASDLAVVANYLLDAVQIVDVKAGKLVRQVQLGGPLRPDLARQGEIIFYDARRSHHQWFSCHTCHPNGHTSSHTFDTLNDDSYGNPKLTPTLRGRSPHGAVDLARLAETTEQRGREITHRYTFRTKTKRRRCTRFDDIPRYARAPTQSESTARWFAQRGSSAREDAIQGHSWLYGLS